MRERFLYNFDRSKVGFLKCQIVGATQYKGQVLTFHALIDGKWMYSDLPIHAFCRNKNFESLSIQVGSLYNIETEEVCCGQLFGIGHDIGVYTGDTFIGASYETSFDFPSENRLLHLVCMEDGEFRLVPNHKVCFDFRGGEKLPDFQKQRAIWRI